MKRIFSLLLIVSLLLCGCGQPSEYIPNGGGLFEDGATLPPILPEDSEELILAYDPTASLNPLVSQNLSNRALFSLIYQGLFLVDRKYNPEPVLCKNYAVSKDMRTYTFYLEEAAFSDGSALTPQDVVASYKAAQESGYYAGRLNHMKSISVAEDGAVVITLDTPVENLPLLLDIPIVKEGQIQAACPLGTGPYALHSTAEGSFLRRQAAWWCNAALSVSAASISLMEVTAQEGSSAPLVLRDRFERGNLAMVFSDPGSDQYVDFRGDFEPWESENGLFLFLGINKESDFFSNEVIRSALTHAIDRDSLVKRFFRTYAYSATLPASPVSPWYDSKLASRYGYNVEAFKTAVSEAQLEGTEITLLVNKDDSRRLRTAWAIRDMLTECGLKITMSEQNSKDFVIALADREYDLYLGQTRLSANMDLTEFFKDDGALSYGGLEDVTLHSMCLDAMANSGNYYNLHKQIMEEGWLCPILFRSYAIYCKRGAFTGLDPARDNLFRYSLGKTMAEARLEN